MMKMRDKLTGLILLAVLLVGAMAVQAGFWDWSTPYQGPEKDLQTLIITGNFTKPRLMAELIQVETKQPILLLPTSPSGKLFFIPANDTALEVSRENFAKFVKFTNPKRILVIGDRNFVPEEFTKQIDKNQTVWRVANKDWNQVAEDAQELLFLNNLARDFRRLEREINSGKLYRPKGADLPPVIPDVAPETEAPPVLPADEELPLDPVTPAVDPEPAPAPAPVPAAGEPKLIKDTEVVPK